MRHCRRPPSYNYAPALAAPTQATACVLLCARACHKTYNIKHKQVMVSRTRQVRGTSNRAAAAMPGRRRACTRHAGFALPQNPRATRGIRAYAQGRVWNEEAGEGPPARRCRQQYERQSKWAPHWCAQCPRYVHAHMHTDTHAHRDTCTGSRWLGRQTLCHALPNRRQEARRGGRAARPEGTTTFSA